MNAGPWPRTRPLLRLLIRRPDGPRIFAEGGPLPEFHSAAEILGRFAPTTIEKDDAAHWKIRFIHRGHNFTVERIAAHDSAYIVDDPSCPDEILIEVRGELDTRFEESVPRRTVRKLYGVDVRIVLGIGFVIALVLTISFIVAMLR